MSAVLPFLIINLSPVGERFWPTSNRLLFKPETTESADTKISTCFDAIDGMYRDRCGCIEIPFLVTLS